MGYINGICKRTPAVILLQPELPTLADGIGGGIGAILPAIVFTSGTGEVEWPGFARNRCWYRNFEGEHRQRVEGDGCRASPAAIGGSRRRSFPDWLTASVGRVGCPRQRVRRLSDVGVQRFSLAEIVAAEGNVFEGGYPGYRRTNIRYTMKRNFARVME